MVLKFEATFVDLREVFPLQPESSIMVQPKCNYIYLQLNSRLIIWTSVFIKLPKTTGRRLQRASWDTDQNLHREWRNTGEYSKEIQVSTLKKYRWAQWRNTGGRHSDSFSNDNSNWLVSCYQKLSKKDFLLLLFDFTIIHKKNLFNIYLSLK